MLPHQTSFEFQKARFALTSHYLSSQKPSVTSMAPGRTSNLLFLLVSLPSFALLLPFLFPDTMHALICYDSRPNLIYASRNDCDTLILDLKRRLDYGQLKYFSPDPSKGVHLPFNFDALDCRLRLSWRGTTPSVVPEQESASYRSIVTVAEEIIEGCPWRPLTQGRGGSGMVGLVGNLGVEVLGRPLQEGGGGNGTLVGAKGEEGNETVMVS